MLPENSFIRSLNELPLTTVLTWVYVTAIIIFFIHWLAASYHWYVFGSERTTSLLSIIVYGAGGVIILAIMGGLLIVM